MSDIVVVAIYFVFDESSMSSESRSAMTEIHATIYREIKEQLGQQSPLELKFWRKRKCQTVFCARLETC